MKRGAEASVGGVPGQDDGLLPRGPVDGALPGVVLPGPGVVEPFLVVAELAECPGRQDHPEARLAEVDGSRRGRSKCSATTSCNCAICSFKAVMMPTCPATTAA